MFIYTKNRLSAKNAQEVRALLLELLQQGLGQPLVLYVIKGIPFGHGLDKKAPLLTLKFCDSLNKTQKLQTTELTYLPGSY